MGKKKKVKKELARQLQLTAAFDGIFDAQLISSVLQEVGNDYDVALIRLTEMSKAIYDGNAHLEHRMATTDNRESLISYLQSIFPAYDRDVISLMLEECNGVVERVVHVISKSSDSTPPPVSQDPTSTSGDFVNLREHNEKNCKLNSSLLPEEEGEESSPIQIMKYVLMDCMPHDEIEPFLLSKDCTEQSSVEQMQSVMNELLTFMSKNTTSGIMTEQISSSGVPENGSHSLIPDVERQAEPPTFSGDLELEMLLYESSLQFDSDLYEDNNNNNNISQLQVSDKGDIQFMDAKCIVRSFFKNSGVGNVGIASVPESMIDCALELSKESGRPGSPGVWCPDAAIGWICEELNALHPRSHCTVADTGAVSMVSGNGSKHIPTTYASKAQFIPEMERKIACEIGGDTEKTEDSNPQCGHAVRASSCRSSSQPLCSFASKKGSSYSAGVYSSNEEMALFWRNVHQESKTSMLRSFSAAANTRSKRTVATAQQFKRDMYRAAAESSKFELIARNPNVKVAVNSGCSVEFIGFEKKHSPKNVISIDMHGVDVRSGVQFVKSLVDNCHRAGNRVVVSLVVGLGNHSIRNIPKLKPAITRFLQNNTKVKLMGCVEGRIEFSVGN